MSAAQNLLDRIGLIQDLEDILGRKVDVVTVKSLRKYFRTRILDEVFFESTLIQDGVIHDYMGIDVDEVWKVVERDLADLKRNFHYKICNS